MLASATAVGDICMTTSYMRGKMKSAVTIRLDKDLEEQLDELVRRSGQSRSEIVREALRRELLRMQFESLRDQVTPFAETRGFLTDEDVFDQIS
jgi:predicted transcriptional regulator